MVVQQDEPGNTFYIMYEVRRAIQKQPLFEAVQLFEVGFFEVVQGVVRGTHLRVPQLISLAYAKRDDIDIDMRSLEAEPGGEHLTRWFRAMWISSRTTMLWRTLRRWHCGWVTWSLSLGPMLK